MNPYNPLTQLVLSSVPPTKTSSSSLFERSLAHGEALDKQAQVIQDKSDQISGGDDKPGTPHRVTAESAKIAYMLKAPTRRFRKSRAHKPSAQK